MGLTVNGLAGKVSNEGTQFNTNSKKAINVFDLPEEILRVKNGMDLDFDSSGFIDAPEEFKALNNILNFIGIKLNVNGNKMFASTKKYQDEDSNGTKYAVKEGFDKKMNLKQSTLTFKVGDVNYSVVIDFNLKEIGKGEQTINENYRIFAQTKNGPIELKDDDADSKKMKKLFLNAYSSTIDDYVHYCKHNYEFYL